MIVFSASELAGEPTVNHQPVKHQGQHLRKGLEKWHFGDKENLSPLVHTEDVTALYVGPHGTSRISNEFLIELSSWHAAETDLWRDST